MGKPKLGQHFLKDAKYINYALKAAGLNKETAVIEIGPGKGILTRELIKVAGFVLALELDERLADYIHERLGHNQNLEIRKADARFIDWDAITQEVRAKGFKKVKLVANLPYYMASQMILHALAAEQGVAEMVVMIQEEMARRICALPNTTEYSSFSIAVQYYGEPHYVVKVPPTAFLPPPRVSSAIIKISKRDKPLVQIKNPENFFTLVQSAFTHRRKIIKNCLQGLPHAPAAAIWEKGLAAANIDVNRRPQSLTIEEYAKIFSSLEELGDQ